MENQDFYNALADLQYSITKVIKNTDNPYYKSKYSDLSTIFEEIKPKIREQGFLLLQRVVGNTLKTELIYLKTGEKVEAEMELLTAKPDMQQLGSAITYARRYSILPLLNIETEDDDGNQASGKEPQTFEEFDAEIRKCKTEKQVSALWYKWKEVFHQDTEEYKKLTKTSSDMKTKLGNPGMNVKVR